MEKKLQLMKARNKVRLAELGLNSDDDSVVDVQVDAQVEVKDCLTGIENSTPICEPPAIKPSSYVVKSDLPGVDLEAFDGNRRCYWRFIQQLKYYIEDGVQDNGQRMLYLIHYCRGPAKEAVVEYAMLPPEISYVRARELLKDLFGRKHMVARAISDDLFKKLKPLHDDADSLSRLPIHLQNCHVALSQMNHASDMNSVPTIEQILCTLSNDARRNLARLADTMDNLGKQTGFADLCNFISQEARMTESGTCLGVVPVRVNGPHGSVLTYALLDSGSDVTLVTKDLLDEVGLTGAPTTLNLSKVGGTATVEAGSLRIEFESLDSDETVAAEQAFSIRSPPISPPVMSLT
ncbi:protein disulfide-isomerase, partial [Clonorchis sinensis]